ncbi:uncharacterized protein BDV17DRAFT_296822 [Aspergillus undulatus]|uniref:uncharacterized protein n=1 Tax=Aspergillus undulatus TaxID=1810928 RepID=UPI003CCD96BA
MSTTNSQADTDLEAGRVRDGYPALSTWISRDPDHEGFIFRRFSRLSARNLLHLQSQLITLEEELKTLDKMSFKKGDTSLRLWEAFEQKKQDVSNERAQHRKRLYDALEMKLKSYHEALALQASISNLRRPRPRVVADFKAWFFGRRPGEGPIINGKAETLLNDPQDLVALRVPIDEDVLSRFLQDHWPFPFIIFQERHVIIVVATISVIASATLLIGAIVSLYIVQEARARLAMIACFTALFATSVAMMTNARRAELFAATAAYAAVLVVFVSGSLG